MAMQNKDFGIKEAITELQGLGICLRIAVYKLPSSAVKQYLLYGVTKPIEINSFADFQRLQDRISNMLSVATQEDLSDGEEVLKLLRAIKEDIEKIANYI